ncbi:hypothetical protein PsorP6_015421 [Peronosclerospora sorghi]|uniref:Uncharacterized protein n=1 Tax=Peronosclerospora sorghi TaxID=230839 RepID=A0ACC0WQ91_9STRA|nr:hypothetical protein PsorP6_015421 [Peronosclerospora sorghi]
MSDFCFFFLKHTLQKLRCSSGHGHVWLPIGAKETKVFFDFGARVAMRRVVHHEPVQRSLARTPTIDVVVEVLGHAAHGWHIASVGFTSGRPPCLRESDLVETEFRDNLVPLCLELVHRSL